MPADGRHHHLVLPHVRANRNGDCPDDPAALYLDRNRLRNAAYSAEGRPWTSSIVLPLIRSAAAIASELLKNRATTLLFRSTHCRCPASCPAGGVEKLLVHRDIDRYRQGLSPCGLHEVQADCQGIVEIEALKAQGTAAPLASFFSSLRGS